MSCIIVCEDGEVRLVDGSSVTNGILEVCIGQVWSTVCNESWDSADVRVVCRQLGYYESSRIIFKVYQHSWA